MKISKKETNIHSRNRMTATTIAILLIFSMTATLVLLPSSTAYNPPWVVPTSAYVSVAPGTVGLGQYTVIVVYTDRYSPTAGGAVGQVWNGYKLEITKPDGTKETIGPWTCSSATGSDFKVYRPDQIGKYSIVFSWPGGSVTGSLANPNSANIGDNFLGSTSKPTTLTVQKDPVPYWPETSLPTSYWTRPINGANRDWSQLASNWLKGTQLVSNYQRSGTGPKSAHILWTAPICAPSPSAKGYPGGIADEQWPTISTNINDYESSMQAPIIMNGVIYYNAPTTQQSTKYGYYAVDLYTGERLWYKNGTDNGLNNPYITTNPSTGSTNPTYAQAFLGLTIGQMYHYGSVNGQGVASFLWMQQYLPTTFSTASSTWYMLDATTGNLILTLKNVPSGTSVTDQDGSLLVYQFNSAKGNILCWNSSKAIYPGGPTSSGAQVFRPSVGLVIDAQNDSAWANTNPNTMGSMPPDLITALKTPHSGYTMNVTDPSLMFLPGPVAAVPGVTPTGTLSVLLNELRVPKAFFGSSLRANYGSIGGSVIDDTIWIWYAKINEHATAYSPWPGLDPSVNTNLGFTVSLQYSKNMTVPLPGQNATWTVSAVDYNSGVFILRNAQTGQLWGYDLTTGNKLWGPTATPPQNEQFYYYSQNTAIYDGTLLCTGQYTGTIYAYDAKTGTQKWVYRASAAPYYFESAYGEQMTLSLGAVCDGLIYTSSTEHSPTNPLWRQSFIRAINIADGTEAWKVQCFSQGFSVADGYIVSASQYDNLVYCIGKGPSATTVKAPEVELPLGSRVLIQGTVTDQSPGQTCLGFPAAGTPAIGEASMQAWMEYLYEQQPKPNNATGVPVHVTAIDPNNNLQDIGITTSDAMGNFAISWTPPVPGVYKVTATFDGSASYGSSNAGTAFLVSETKTAPAVNPTLPPPSETAPPTAPTPTPVQPPVSPSPSEAVTPPTSAEPTATYIAIAAAVIVIVVAAAVLVLKRRK